MSQKLLYLKLTDLLLFSLLIKSQAGVDILEENNDVAYTSPREYFWIFILNQKLNRNVDPKRLKTLVRSIFWVWQITFYLKRFYKEKDNRKKKLSFVDAMFHYVPWMRTIIDVGDKKGSRIMNLRQFYDNFTKEIMTSDLSPGDKKMILKLRDNAAKRIFTKAQSFMNQDFDRLSLSQISHWYEITYFDLTEFFVSIYLIMIGIKPSQEDWKIAINFAKKMAIIGAIHDDVSDIKGDIDKNGRLREPNLFACFLTDTEKTKIGAIYQGIYTHTSMEQIKKEFPSAYKKVMALFKDKLREISLIPGTNLHELLEFFIIHCPGYFLVPLAPDSQIKKTSRIDSLKNITFEKNSLSLVKKFRQFVDQQRNNTYDLQKPYFDLVAYLYCRELYLSGKTLSSISLLVDRPVSTVKHWVDDQQLPLSLRRFKRLDKIVYCKDIFYLLGVFSFAGTVKDGYLRISSKDTEFLRKLNKILSSDKYIIFQTKKQRYLRLYNQDLASVITNKTQQLVSMLRKATYMEQNDFMNGFIDAKKKTNSYGFSFSLPIQTDPNLILWLDNYIIKQNWKIRKRKKGVYYYFHIIDAPSKVNGKNIPVEMQKDSSCQDFAKAIILRYFGSQKKEFWDEFPGLYYICLGQAKAKFNTQKKNSGSFLGLFKYQLLAYFKAYFQNQSRTTATFSPTNSIDSFEDKEGEETVDWKSLDKERTKKALKKLEKLDRRQYLTVALRYGFIDGKEHTLTGDLSQRLFDLGVKTKNNQPLAKSQAYLLLKSSLARLRLII